MVEWHMSGDLKTIKCMYNIGKGANSKAPCIYCMEPTSNLDSKWWKKAPNRDKCDPKFKAILDIPLGNVHICTLHAFCRIIEKLVFLYIGFAWKLRPEKNRRKAIESMERVLFDIGLQGKNVKITKDLKKSTNGQDVPCKPSIGGAKARRFLSQTRNKTTMNKGILHNSTVKYDVWRAVHNAVKDHEANGVARTSKAAVWESLDVIFKYCDKQKIHKPDIEALEEHIRKFGKSRREAWIELNITHYMVRLKLNPLLVYPLLVYQLTMFLFVAHYP